MGLTTLGDVATIIVGQSPSGDSYNKDGIGVPLLNGPAEFGAEHPIEVQWTDDPQRTSEPGDILFCVRGATAGRTNISDKVYAIGRGLAAIRAKSGIADTGYLHLALLANIPKLLKGASGSTFLNLPSEKLRDVLLPLPSLREQRRFSNRHSEQSRYANLALAAVQRQIEDSNRLETGMFLDAFSGELPIRDVRSVMQRKARNYSKLIDLARLESGHTPSRRHPEWWGGEIPWLALPDIRKLHGKFAYETMEYTNDAGIANSSARMLPVGTVCVSRTASIGFVTILGKSMATSQDFCNWICNPDKLDPEFLMYAFMASRDAVVELGSGAVHKTIYMPTIETFHICVPELKEQRRITGTLRERLAAAESLTAGLKARLADIERLPQRLLAAAFGAA